MILFCGAKGNAVDAHQAHEGVLSKGIVVDAGPTSAKSGMNGHMDANGCATVR